MVESRQTRPTHKYSSSRLWVYTSTTFICRFLHGGSTDAARISLTPKFYYMWDMVKSVHFQWSRDLRESTKRLIAQHLIYGEGADLVFYPRCLIKKDNLTFTAKFFYY